ncbi:tumor protein p53-inducible protein 13 [Gouania willdenowi]|uniref:tumor protein p53-inducible protein 13 n=1 Tax=Gouania willdenowi TaxID=441366 RepID=UPI001055A21D|nr:tumor protein p53-inducible protein 13 [Gouania willdenowi]
MPGRATSRWLTVAVVTGLWVTVGRCGASEAHRCDNGKHSVDMDVFKDAVHWDCAAFRWPKSPQRLQSVDSVNNPQPPMQICMDKSISYNHSIPSSGSYRPVRAESGEYLYCPPQRWLNNLHHGAAVLLYHPCAEPLQRHLLSELARSCLSHFILSPHPQLSRLRPIVLVSWGHTLELPSVASPETCRWLELHQSKHKKSAVSPTLKYNLLLTWSAEQQRLSHPIKLKESLRQCCEQAIRSALSRTKKNINEKRKTREVRTATINDQQKVERRGPIINNTGQVQEHEVSLGSNKSEDPNLEHLQGSAGSSSSKHSQAGQPLSSKENLIDLVGHKDQDSSHLNKAEEKSFSTNGKMKENQVIHVTERDLENKPEHQGGNPGLDSQSESKPQQSLRLANGSSGAPVLIKGLPRTPRNDEAVWAAAALGFLLVLLTLSVLHTRLYRQWRTMPSLYWHDTRQDYDSVADVIRRRLRITKRRRKPSRRPEVVLLPTSSSSDELP